MEPGRGGRAGANASGVHSPPTTPELVADEAAGVSVSDDRAADGERGPRGASAACQPALCRDPAIPRLARIALPLLLLGNMALLLWSNCGVGATVHLRLYDGDDGGGHERSIDAPVLYEVTLRNSIVDMWQAKAYIMSALIAVFSGAWPHVKIVVSLLCWVLDGRTFSRDTRRLLLTLSYVLQKLSHIETFVLVIMMVAFSMKARLPEHEEWGVWAFVRPQAGFFSFLAGLCLSMLLSRVALHYDYVATEAYEAAAAAAAVATNTDAERAHGEGGMPADSRDDDDEEEDDDKRGESQASTVTHGGPRRCAAVLDGLDLLGVPSGSAWQDIMGAYFLVALAVFLAVGIATPCFLFEFQGLAGWVLDHVTENTPGSSSSLRSATVLSLGSGIPGASDSPNGAGVRLLQTAYFFFVVGAPLGCLALLLGLAVLPMRVGGQLLTAAEVLYAWSAPDVLFISLVASTLEMKLFVRFVIGNKCDGLNAILRELFDKELDGDDKCFDLTTSLETGVWILGSASLAFFGVGALVLRNVQREQKHLRARPTATGGAPGGALERRSTRFPWWAGSGSRSATIPLLEDEEEGEEVEVQDEDWLAERASIERRRRRNPPGRNALIQGAAAAEQEEGKMDAAGRPRQYCSTTKAISSTAR